MHENSMEMMRDFIKEYVLESHQSVADVGSLVVNGQNDSYRSLFMEHDYTGIDIVAGRNVDIVVGQYKWSQLKDETYDIVVSGQMLEHCKRFWIVTKEMKRILKRGGLMCIIAPWRASKHKFPVDCWRFMPDGMVDIGEWLNMAVLKTVRKKDDCIGIFRK